MNYMGSSLILEGACWRFTTRIVRVDDEGCFIYVLLSPLTATETKAKLEFTHTMRIRAAIISKQQDREVTSLCLFDRCRSIETSTSLRSFSYVMHSMRVKILMTRKWLSRSFHFKLSDLDDQICIQRFCFTNNDLLHVRSWLQWALERYWTRRRNYSTSPVLPLLSLRRFAISENRCVTWIRGGI